MVIDPLSYFSETNLFQQPSLEGTNEEGESVGESGSMGCGCQNCIGQPRNKMLGKFQGYHEIDPQKDEPSAKDEEFFFLCDYRISGLVLKSRKWGMQALFY